MGPRQLLLGAVFGIINVKFFAFVFFFVFPEELPQRDGLSRQVVLKQLFKINFVRWLLLDLDVQVVLLVQGVLVFAVHVGRRSVDISL